MTYWNVTPEDFVEIWQRSDSAAEAAMAMGMPANVCRRRATYYRRIGIPLKKFKSRRLNQRRLSVEELTKLANEHHRDYPSG